MAIPGFKKALADAGVSKATFARAAKLATATVYAWGDAGPAWAFEFLKMMMEVEDLRRRVHVLERLSTGLIHGDHRQ
ncbi:MAG: hypothetical protein EBS53_16040 [Bacteroidetes bacterium]|nr:hypothetical protein [Bacteroidota bacterium]